MAGGESRRAGRNPTETPVRNRVWERFIATGVNVGPAFGRIPSFFGVDVDAKRLSELVQLVGRTNPNCGVTRRAVFRSWST